MTQALQQTNKASGVVEYTPLGSSSPIKLSVGIVMRQIATPTKSGARPSEQDCLDFLMMCRAQRLDPFAGDAYLVGYDTKDGAKFTKIVAHVALLKRAEGCGQYDGMESGVIVQERDESIQFPQGDLVLPGQTLLGGWATAYRKDQKIPTARKIGLQGYNSGRSLWADRPNMMIVKCAEADALRSAFPSSCGGLYIREERAELNIDISPPDQPQRRTASLLQTPVDDGDDTDLAPQPQEAKA